MIELITSLFVTCGNLLLKGPGIITLSSVLSTLEDSLYEDEGLQGTLISLLTVSILSASANDVKRPNEVDTEVMDSQMIVESMSLEELYELRDLVEEKDNGLKLYM